MALHLSFVFRAFEVSIDKLFQRNPSMLLLMFVNLMLEEIFLYLKIQKSVVKAYL
jgi:hypothetical protein